MPSTFDPLLRLELQATGENENTWGDKANNNFELLAQSIAGHVSVAATGSGDLNLTSGNAVTDEARQAFITLSGTLTGTRNIIIPSVSKTYYFRRNTSGVQTINVKTASGAAATLASSGISIVVCDGVDCWLVEDATRLSAAGGQITGPVSVSVSTSTSGGAAFTIKQVGTGPALVVEDSTGDTTPFIIDDVGNVFVGSSASYAVDGLPFGTFQVNRNNQNAGGLFGAWPDSSSGPFIHFIKSRGGTVGTQAAVTISDSLGRFVFAGDDGADFIGGAGIQAQVAASVSSGVVPGRLLLQTAGAAGTLATRVVVDQNGNVGIGTTSPAEALHIVGNFRIGSAVLSQPTGSAPLTMARAWCTYIPSGPTLVGSNFASVTKNAVGDFTFTFTTAMPNNTYAPIVFAVGGAGASYVVARLEGFPTAGSFRIQCVGAGAGGVDFDIDPGQIYVAVFA
jgi:hypothetical protein